jgi:hypothetical protein
MSRILLLRDSTLALATRVTSTCLMLSPRFPPKSNRLQSGSVCLRRLRSVGCPASRASFFMRDGNHEDMVLPYLVDKEAREAAHQRTPRLDVRRCLTQQCKAQGVTAMARATSWTASTNASPNPSRRASYQAAASVSSSLVRGCQRRGAICA